MALIDSSLSITEAGNWRTGYKIYGTPGYSNIPPRISKLYLNEISGVEQIDYSDNFGEYEDWIELYNGNNHEINFGGLYLTDDLKDLTMNQVMQNSPESTTIAAHGFKVLFADKELDQGILHLDFKIGSSGENLGLVQLVGLDTVILDQVSFGTLTAGNSLGRRADGEAPWEVQVFTPGSSNNSLNMDVPDQVFAEGFPNPASDLLYVRLINSSEGYLYFNVVNALGQLVFSEERQGFVPGEVISMDVSGLQTGIYFLKITSGEFVSVKRIVITR